MFSNFITNLKRIIFFGWQSLSRNKGLSFGVIFIMSVAVLLITSLFLFQGFSEFLISEAQKKVDISVYFKKNITPEKIFAVESDLRQTFPKVENIEYISQEKALEIFKEKHKDDTLYLDALKEVGDNPFLASLNIKTNDPNIYSQISNFLGRGPTEDLIEKVSYYQNKKVIDKLFSFTNNMKKGGIVLSVILALLIALITFNTVKLTIGSFKEEISTMRLVGASNWFIRGPFLIQGLLYGIISVLIVDIVLFSVLYFLNPKLGNWFLDFNLLNYFKTNFFLLVSVQFIFSVILGVFSSFIAVHRYLKI